MAAELARFAARVCVATWLCCTLPADASTVGRLHQYTAEVSPGLARIDVRACLDRDDAARALRLVADPELVRFARDLRTEVAPLGPSASTNVVPVVSAAPSAVAQFVGNTLTVPKASRCLTYWVDLAAAARAGSGVRRSAARLGGDMKTNADLWLLKPRLTGEDRIALQVALPPGTEM